MKIIFSPTKSMDFSNIKNMKNHDFDTYNIQKTNELFNLLSTFSSEDLSKLMKVKNKTLESTVEFYKNNNKSQTQLAINSYNGISFKQLQTKEYDKSQVDYLNSNLIILSAMFGIIKPNNYIFQYRLDMTMKLFKDSNLYKYWQKDIDDYFKGEELIINLASKEFSKLIKYPMINIDFKENKNGIFKSVSSYSKKARGLMLNYLITNKITNIKKIKEFNLENYQLNTELSDENNIIFTR